jgi:Arc/MetJ-type ribon-helix-helix transcriptional regulator
MTVQVPIRITEEDLAALDRAVASGRYKNRSEALRAGLKKILREERDREIEESYRRGYGKYPQEEWIGKAGLAALEALFASEQDDEPL